LRQLELHCALLLLVFTLVVQERRTGERVKRFCSFLLTRAAKFAGCTTKFRRRKSTNRTLLLVNCGAQLVFAIPYPYTYLERRFCECVTRLSPTLIKKQFASSHSLFATLLRITSLKRI
jgi:hypothetical protein